MTPNENTRIRVLIADDHPIYRAGLRMALANAPDIEVIGEAQNGLEAQRLVTELNPDILLLDLVMPDMQPYEIEKWVRSRYPHIVTLILTGHDRACFLAQAIELGVAGYLTKDANPPKIIEAIRRAARKDYLISDDQIAVSAQWWSEIGQYWQTLTKRERQILYEIVRGLSNKEIAQKLNIKPKTAEHHTQSIFRKLRVDSRSRCIAWVKQNIPEEWFAQYTDGH